MPPVDDPVPVDVDAPATTVLPVDPAPAPHDARRRGPRRVLAETGYALAAFPLGLVGFVLVVTGVAVGGGLTILTVGLPVLALTAVVARGFAHLERSRMRALLDREAPTPTYAAAQPHDGWFRRVLTPLRDPQSWLDMVWAVLALVTGTLAFVAVVTTWALVLGGLTFWFWQRWLPDQPDNRSLAELLGLGDGRGAESALNLALGLLALVLLPWVVRLVALLHAGLAEALLCSRASLQAEVRRATGGRDAARDAEARSLRRLERDIHDGPQQRLVRLAMDIGRARHQLDQDPERAREALDAAYTQARDAIDELRALSRGIAPPLLVDRGLGPALEELVNRADAEVELRIDPELAHGLAPHVEAALYFVVAEGMTNVAKHSGAATVLVQVEREGDVVAANVADDGIGGAHRGKGSGLAGLEQRVLGLGGRLLLSSPPGGPTVLRAEVPLDG